jgi:thiol-disulfide isomerase/thioredoxin
MNFWLLLAASDGRGWSPGQPAARTAEVLTVPAPLPFAAPDALARRLDRPTALFYFAPGCPHCQHVAAEVAALHERLLASGAAVLGVAVGSSADADIRDFERRYGIDFPILVDRDREIARALGARATPTVVLVTPRDGTVVEIGRWAPYEPTFDAFVEARLAPGGLFSLFTPGRTRARPSAAPVTQRSTGAGRSRTTAWPGARSCNRRRPRRASAWAAT